MDNSPFFFLTLTYTLALTKSPTGMSTLEKIGVVIKTLRNNMGLSQEQFCTQCGIDQHYLSNIENGQRNLSVDIVERIASCFDMALPQLFDRVESVDDSSTSSIAPVTSINRENFITYMELHHLSQRTIKKYSDDTPSCTAVQRIIRDVTGVTTDMYRVVDPELVQQIIDRVRECDFDQIGHSMYSAGLKKYKAYLEHR